MTDHTASQSKLIDLRGRAGELAESLLHDPNRPFWQVELVRILSDLCDVMEIISTERTLADSVCSDLQQRLTSCETRYSELLYRMSERS